MGNNLDILARVAPFTFYIAVMAVSNVFAEKGIDVRWLYAVRVGGAALLLLYFRKQYSELFWQKPVILNHISWAILAGILVFLLWISLDSGWMMLGRANGYNPLAENGELNLIKVVMRMAGAVLVVPLMEELFWRSFIMRWIDSADFSALAPIRVSVKALLISALVFAIEHTFWLSGLLAGLIYGLLYVRTQNLWIATIAHAITNGLLGAWVLTTGHWNYW